MKPLLWLKMILIAHNENELRYEFTISIFIKLIYFFIIIILLQKYMNYKIVKIKFELQNR